MISSVCDDIYISSRLWGLGNVVKQKNGSLKVWKSLWLFWVQFCLDIYLTINNSLLIYLHCSEMAFVISGSTVQLLYFLHPCLPMRRRPNEFVTQCWHWHWHCGVRRVRQIWFFLANSDNFQHICGAVSDKRLRVDSASLHTQNTAL